MSSEMRSSIPLDVIERYLAGKATPNEVASLGVGRAQADLIEALRGAVRGADLPEPDVASWLSSFHQETGSNEETQRQGGREQGMLKRVEVRGTLRKWVGYSLAAATVACFLAFATSELLQLPGMLKARPEIKEYRTVSGQIAKITLPDNSTIVLAPMSRIQYSADFGASTDRTVSLEGEALFTITHSSGAPFTVNTNGITTRVLGTSFAVRRYVSDTAVKVIVAQGKVSLGSTILSTGDVAIAKSSQLINVSRENVVASQLSWTEGRLSYSGVPLRNVIPDLERWYGISIEVAPELLDRPVYTQLDTESVSTAMELVALAASGRSEVLGNRVILRSR